MAITGSIDENPILTKYKELVSTKIKDQIVWSYDTPPLSSFGGKAPEPNLFSNLYSGSNLQFTLNDKRNDYRINLGVRTSVEYAICGGGGAGGAGVSKGFAPEGSKAPDGGPTVIRFVYGPDDTPIGDWIVATGGQGGAHAPEGNLRNTTSPQTTDAQQKYAEISIQEMSRRGLNNKIQLANDVLPNGQVLKAWPTGEIGGYVDFNWIKNSLSSTQTRESLNTIRRNLFMGGQGGAANSRGSKVGGQTLNIFSVGGKLNQLQFGSGGGGGGGSSGRNEGAMGNGGVAGELKTGTVDVSVAGRQAVSVLVSVGTAASGDLASISGVSGSIYPGGNSLGGAVWLTNPGAETLSSLGPKTGISSSDLLRRTADDSSTGFLVGGKRIFDLFLSETNLWMGVRKAKLDFGGGQYDSAISNVGSGHSAVALVDSDLDSDHSRIAGGMIISDENIELYFNNLYSQWNTRCNNSATALDANRGTADAQTFGFVKVSTSTSTPNFASYLSQS